MPGKLTILDRLAREGRIVPKIGTREIQAGLTLDPLSLPGAMLARDEFRRAGMGRFANMTPERQVYQRGLQAIRDNELAAVNDRYRTSEGMLTELQSDFEDSYDDAYAEMKEDLFTGRDEAPSLAEGFSPQDDLNIGIVKDVDLRDYWPPYARSPDEYASEAEDYVDQMKGFTGRAAYLESPEYLMELQSHSPRYHNYQRVMEQRAANKAVGRDLSRRYATAVRNLVRRGLSPEEADAYVRGYFGAR